MALESQNQDTDILGDMMPNQTINQCLKSIVVCHSSSADVTQKSLNNYNNSSKVFYGYQVGRDFIEEGKTRDEPEHQETWWITRTNCLKD